MIMEDNFCFSINPFIFHFSSKYMIYFVKGEFGITCHGSASKMKNSKLNIYFIYFPIS